MLRYPSPAKINLVLEVLGRRDDGFHELRSIVQTIDLCDILYFELDDVISFECTVPVLNTSDNLVVKAAKLFKEATACHKGVRVRLEKRVPWGAGLGGGSSNAAATLLALNKLWEVNLSFNELTRLATKLGSDVPFFLYGGLALVEGRGERVTPLGTLKPQWQVLLVSPFARTAEKTKKLFSLLQPQHFTRGQFVDSALEIWYDRKQIPPSSWFNVFDAIAFDAFPGLDRYWRRLQERGLQNIHVAGSGPALFAPAKSRREAEDIANALERNGLEAYAVCTNSPMVQPF